MKRARLLGIAVLLAPTAGCATFPFASAAPAPAAAASMTAPAPKAAQLNTAPDIEGTILDGQNKRKAGDLPGSARTLSQLVLVAPDNARVLGEYGKTLAAMGRSDDALAFLDRAIQLEPGEWTFYSARGIAYDQKGNYPAAQASYDRALMLKPGEPAVLNNAALSHIQSGDLDGAQKLLNDASPSSPDYARIAQNLALIQSLRAAHPPKAAATLAPQPVPTTLETGEAPTSVADANPAAVPSPEPVMSAPLPAPVQSSETAHVAEAPQASVLPRPMSKFEALRADPTVMMAPMPKETAAPATPKAVAAKSEAVAMLRPSEKPAPAVVPVAKPETPPKAAPVSTNATPVSRTYYVQAGAFFKQDQAGVAASALDRLGARVMSGENNGRTVFRVRIGPFLTMQQAKTAVAQAQSMGHADLQIVTQ